MNQSYHHIQEKESRLMADLSLAQAQLFPLRKENARLARENHELHLDHIKQNEESRSEKDEFLRKMRDLNDQLTEVRLMNKLLEEQLRERDDVIEKLREVRRLVCFFLRGLSSLLSIVHSFPISSIIFMELGLNRYLSLI